jgi:predicted nicotinamide N-methyase
MTYPTQVVEIKKGLVLHVPQADLVKQVYEEMCQLNPATPFPYWAKIWPAAYAMTQFLQQSPHWIQGKHVLEIGAGIGLPSFCIASQVQEIMITDHAIAAVELMQKNIEWLQLKNAKAICIDWNAFPNNLTTEVILLSDVNYAPEQFNSLQTLIQHFITGGATILLATPTRITATPFVQALQPYIQSTQLQTVELPTQLVEIGILVLHA